MQNAVKKKQNKSGSVSKKVRKRSAKATRGSANLPTTSKKKPMKFVESNHTYTEDGVNYTAVTSFLHSFQVPVDWDAECRKKAKKLGITYKELKAQWDEKRDLASAKGTAYHKLQEARLLNDRGYTVENVFYPAVTYHTANGVKEDKEMKLQDNTVYSEKMIWSRKYGICGTADLVEVVNGRINIKDYKTNAKLDTESYNHPLTGRKKLKSPVNGLDDCNFNIYSLQINLYMYMLLQNNRHLKMGNMTILHVNFDEDNDAIFQMPYEVKNLQKEVHLMLEHFKSKRV